MPVRVQMRRTKGWLKPENTVYVGRPTIFGNPFHSAPDTPRSLAFEAALFRDWLLRELGVEPMMKPEHKDFWKFTHFMASGTDLKRKSDQIRSALPLLRGKNLACWCPLTDKDGNPSPCHADILLEIANKEPARWPRSST